MKVLFINDPTTNPNWGGRAVTVALRTMIGQSGGDIFKTITFDDIGRSSLDGQFDPTVSRVEYRHVVRAVAPDWLLALRRKLAPNLLRDRGERHIPRRWEEYDSCAKDVAGSTTPWPDLVQSFRDMDVAVVYAGGDIYGNGTVPRTLFFLSFLIKRHFDKPVIMVDHTADLGHPDLLKVAEKVYPLLDDVVFRDHISAERCSDLCAGKLGADSAFWFRPAPKDTWASLAGRPTYFDVWPDTASFDPSKPYLCIGGSASFGEIENLDALLSGYQLLIARIRSSYLGQIVLTVSDTPDQAVFRTIAKRLHLPLVGLTTPVQQAVDILGNADAYIGGRWHPSIFALRGGRPVLPLASHTFKMQALIDTTGLPPEVFDPLDLEHNADAVVRRLLENLAEGDELGSRLRSWAEKMAEKSWTNVAYLDSIS
jgi:polysaccharide pyruvyl transferase WcaK-like protein